MFNASALLVLLVVAGCATTGPPPTVCFSPAGHCDEAVVRELNSAHRSIRMQAYGFTHPGIAKALTDAQARGVDVAVILDKSNLTQRSSEANLIAQAGVRTFIDAKHPIAHDKVIVIDQRNVVTGSFNFTKAAAERNAENLLVIHSTSLAAQYLGDWEVHRAHSTAYETTAR